MPQMSRFPFHTCGPWGVLVPCFLIRLDTILAPTGIGGSPVTTASLCRMLQAIEDARDPEVRARHQRLLASWQAALPSLFPSIKVRLAYKGEMLAWSVLLRIACRVHCPCK